MKLNFKILLNGEAVSEVAWGPGVYRVGRSEFCDLLLSNENISRSQLEIRITEEAVYATNMAAAGRLKINGEIIETGEVKEGDVLTLGPYELLAQFGMAFSDEPPPLPEEGIPGEAKLSENDWDVKVKEIAVASQTPQAPYPEVVLPKEPTRFATEGTSALRSETLVEQHPVVAKLIFTGGPKRGTELFLDAFEVTLGRSKKADIFINDDRLSRVHAKITRVGLGYRLIDLSSRHGTFVNGVRILEHPLTSFDTIELGRSKLQFLIHDMASADMHQQGVGGTVVPLAETKSLQLVVNPAELSPKAGRGKADSEPLSPPSRRHRSPETAKPRQPLLLAALALCFLVMAWWVMKPPPAPKKEQTPLVQIKPAPEVKLPPTIPREFADLTPENQRAVEGYYNSALSAAEKSNWDDALWNLRKLRELISYYKQSIELTETYTRRLKEKQLEETQKKAASSEQTDLARYLNEGMEYLKEGNFDLAADAFNQAITIDPNNELAKKGLRASEYKVKRLEDLPLERNPERDKERQVADLFQTALTALQAKRYQEAIDAGEKIRSIELKRDTQYLNEAKIIIDRARLLQKEDFEQFLLRAKEKIAEGDYMAGRDLCDEMLKRDPSYDEAKECSLKAKRQLNRLAKENYTTGYVLESMNRIEEAKQYWNRAKNFVRPGDPYYDKVMKKLEEYQ